jgi:Prealbumin-like fold domain
MRKAAIVAMLAMLASLLIVVPALASHPEASLAGSNFEIDVDANLKVDDPAPPSLDWANVNEQRETDAPTGQNDDSYKGGVKEDTQCPGEVTGSIPNNKSDLLSFGAYVEPETGGPGFLNLFWSRVADPSGTTLMDFELNHSSTPCSVGPNVVRTAGDLLIEYAIDQGGAVAKITVREWTGSAWGPATDLTGTQAAGTINTTPIPAAESDGLISTGQLNARTFGEAQLDLDFIFDEGKCDSFGSAMLKSRSSDAFTSQLKDFISPVPVTITNCGSVIIRKVTDPASDPATTQFGYTKSFGTDPATGNTFSLGDGESTGDTFVGNVLFGTGYTVDETSLPANWAFVNVDCSESSSGVTPTINGSLVTFDIDNSADILDCTYTNRLQVGALKILKNSTKGGPVATAGAVFSYDGQTVTDNGAGDEDPTTGVVCVSGLSPGDYTVDETSPPPGYGDASEAPQTVTVSVGTNCTDNQPTGTGVATFTNPPLADIQVNFRDGGSGETSVTSIDCAGLGTTPDTPDATPATGWGTSVTHEDISIDPSPRTIVCTIVIDP